jgi:hypothetical protein
MLHKTCKIRIGPPRSPKIRQIRNGPPMLHKTRKICNGPQTSPNIRQTCPAATAAVVQDMTEGHENPPKEHGPRAVDVI